MHLRIYMLFAHIITKKLTLRGVDFMNIVESTLLQISVPLNGKPVSLREVEALNQSGNQEVRTLTNS